MAEISVITPMVASPEPVQITVRPKPEDVTKPKNLSSNTPALPERLNEMPEWQRSPLRRFLRLKQRNWPAKTLQRSTRQLFNRLNHMTSFFMQNYEWSEWHQLAPHWLEDYIDTKLREGKAPATINWDLNNFRVFCRFLVDEGYQVPESIIRVELLNTPRRLPRPLPEEQVRRLECCVRDAVIEAKADFQRALAIRDLACFYLLWHCGLRTSEVCSLLVNEIDLEGRKLFIRNSKERKDRVVYMSETAAMAMQQHLAFRPEQDVVHSFNTRRGTLSPRCLQRRLVHYGQQCSVPVTAQRLRHTFASQMLAAGMPVTSLQRYLGHEYLDTTMLYAEVSDPLLREDYYQGIAAPEPPSANSSTKDLEFPHQDELRKLVKELKMPGLAPVRHDEILEQMQRLLASAD